MIDVFGPTKQGGLGSLLVTIVLVIVNLCNFQVLMCFKAPWRPASIWTLVFDSGLNS